MKQRLLRIVLISLAVVGSALAIAWYIDGTRSMPTAAVRPIASSEGAAGSETLPGATEHERPNIPPSRCMGQVNAGSLENGWPLPSNGHNFQTYSGLGSTMGRTFVHSTVFDIVLDAYAQLRRSHPELQFVYGETGLRTGGEFKPHRTHQTGTSVDFMMPVRDENGAPAVLPTSPANKWGYDIDFDAKGHWNGLSIDLEAVAAHLAALRQAAAAKDIPISKVVLFPPIRRKLVATKAWSQIVSLPFTQKEAWVRHDDHYHVDFGVPCRRNE